MDITLILQILGGIYAFQLVVLLGFLGISKTIIEYEDKGEFLNHFIPFYWLYKIISNIIYNIRNF